METKDPNNHNICLDLPSQLQELLPCGYSYKLKKWTPSENKPNHFEAVILVNIYTEEEAQEWWHEFNIKSNTTMRVRATCPKTGKVNIFKIYLRCLHQGRTEKTEKPDQRPKLKSVLPIKRNTNCPAGMIIAIRRLIKYSRSKMRDPVDPVHPCEIQIRFIHNHPTNSADTLRFRPVSKEAEEKLLSLYQIGHSPASALETLKIDLQMEHGTLYSQVISDRYHCPDKSFCYRLYYKHFGKDYVVSSMKDISSALKSKVAHYNTLFRDTCLSFGVSENDYAIAICTPLMKRAHSLSQSGDMVYIDVAESPGNKERAEHHVLMLVAHTTAGGIPLGAVLTTSNNAPVLTLGFRLLKQLLPEHAFYGRGISGPHAFLTEDSENQQTALNSMWPDSDIIICIFRILQSMWRWLWDEKHNILKDHRLYLLYLVKTLLFASSDAEIANKYHALCADNIIVHYPMYLQKVENFWQRRHLWGICFHRLLPLQGASNYYEAAVRALKDKVFEQTKTFNIIQLLNYLVTRLDSHYRIKLLDILQEKIIHIFRSHFPDEIPDYVGHGIKQVAGNYFLIPSEHANDKFYTVDAELNTCSCSSGINGALCLHQYWIFLKMPTDMFKVGFLDADFKQKLCIIATGSTASFDTYQTLIPPELSTEIISTNSNPEIQSNVDPTTALETVYTETNSPNVPETTCTSDNVISSLPNNNELVSLSSNTNCHQITSHSFVNIIPTTSEIVVNSHIISQEDGVQEDSGSKSESRKTINTPNNSLNMSTDETKVFEDSYCNSEISMRMTNVAEKFDKFYQRVKDGLKQQPKDFLPALEIMMKNIERKGNSSDHIISGLSFFGVISAPSLLMKGRKRSCAVTEEIVPKVHGRQMITYGRKRLVSNGPGETTDDSKPSSSVTITGRTPKEMIFNAGSEN